ncbi:hypothetical protein P3T27_001343 [Kitasatospora sp. MAA19]|uniref:hypothetical protein n=1 Tax=Kitasatospora sp. MAA19 TaxID=3035090 RepID=UPI002474C1F1|nr:hypothetical protein [Kitasatospora sp. MAA19]MDH6704640.1 hypothetical protein [Kitasatospora sp. MAA19]
MADNWGAVISAASALGGVGFTGPFGVLRSRQERLAQQMSTREERRSAHRLERREAYIRLMAAMKKVQSAGHTCRDAVPPSSDPWPPIWQNYYEALVALDREAEYVQLEGPPEVSDAARDLNSSAVHSYYVLETAAKAHLGATQPLVTLLSDEQMSNRREEDTRLHDFIASARRALGGEDPGFAQS